MANQFQIFVSSSVHIHKIAYFAYQSFWMMNQDLEDTLTTHVQITMFNNCVVLKCINNAFTINLVWSLKIIVYTQVINSHILM